MVQRKTTDKSSKDYWDSLEKLAREVREMPSWMKVGTPVADCSSNDSQQKTGDSGNKKKGTAR